MCVYLSLELTRMGHDHLRASHAYSNIPTDNAMKAIIKRFGPKLHHLNLAGCSLLSGNSFFEIRARCRELRELDISRLSDLPAAALLGLFLSQATRAEELAAASANAMHTSIFTDDHEQTISGKQGFAIKQQLLLPLPPLRRVNLASLTHVTDDVLWHLVSSCGQHLVSLNISGCHRLTGRSAMMIALHCPAMQTLDISFVRGILCEALVHVVNSCPRLQQLMVWGCTQLNEVFYNGHNNMDLLVVGQNRSMR